MLEVIGLLTVTGILLFFTWWFIGTLWFQHAMAGPRCLDWQDWLYVLVSAVPIVVGWVLWWLFIGSTVNINVSFG